MAKRKAKRNGRTSKSHGGFKISGAPLARLTAEEPPPDVADSICLPHVRGRPILFAIARDARTIFASWNIDWRTVFEKAVPADRQVHLRLIAGGDVEQAVAVEPMNAGHYIKTSRLRDSYRVEIGYFQPADTWHSVAMSDEIQMPPQGFAEIADVDLATIPFHLSFQQLANLFGAPNDIRLAKVISKFQNFVLNSHSPNEWSSAETLVRKLELSLADIAVTQRDFEKSDTEKLARRIAALLRFRATSPARGFEANSP
jgi:Domain of unknown function (DUF4912)